MSGGKAVFGDDLARVSWALVDSHHRTVGKDFRHKAVEDGQLYGFYEDAIDVVNGESLDILIITGSKDIHVVLSAASNDSQTIPELYENTEVSDNGTEVLASNFNRNYEDNPLAKIYKSPTVVDAGFKFVSRRILSGGQGAFRVSSEVVDNIERVFKANTNYLVRIIADGGGTDIVATGVFYEEETAE